MTNAELKAKLINHQRSLETAKAIMAKSRKTEDELECLRISREAFLEELEQEDINTLLRPAVIKPHLKIIYSNGVRV